MRFRLARTVVGLPLFVVGNVVSMITVGWLFWYLLGCMISLVGGYVISRMVNYSLNGIGFAFMGLPMFFLSMLPNAYSWTGFETPTVFAIRLFMSFIGALMLFASVNEES